MHQHIGRAAFGNLREAGGLPTGRGMNVQGIERRPLALRRKLCRELRQPVQIGNLLLAQQVIRIRPAFQALCGAHANEPAPRLQNLQTFAMLESRDHSGSGSQILAKIDGGWTRVRDSCDGLRFRPRLGRR
jgi:hypothetical protein